MVATGGMVAAGLCAVVGVATAGMVRSGDGGGRGKVMAGAVVDKAASRHGDGAVADGRPRRGGLVVDRASGRRVCARWVGDRWAAGVVVVVAAGVATATRGVAEMAVVKLTAVLMTMAVARSRGLYIERRSRESY